MMNTETFIYCNIQKNDDQLWEIEMPSLPHLSAVIVRFFFL